MRFGAYIIIHLYKKSYHKLIDMNTAKRKFYDIWCFVEIVFFDKNQVILKICIFQKHSQINSVNKWTGKHYVEIS